MGNIFQMEDCKCGGNKRPTWTRVLVTRPLLPTVARAVLPAVLPRPTISTSLLSSAATGRRARVPDDPREPEAVLWQVERSRVYVTCIFGYIYMHDSLCDVYDTYKYIYPLLIFNANNRIHTGRTLS